jgi:hypothetical protein
VRDELIFALVVVTRLGVPLAVFRYPLPAIIGCLVVDAADQTIFQAFSTLSLDNYQTYDKALDVYYLALAYLATIRNWGGGPDFDVGRVLWYYRLLGVVLFEYTSTRWVLFVFPNTFEYFFIVLEAYNVRRDPNRLTMRHVVAIAAVLWIVVKLPQEWWIHIARRDVTDELRAWFGVGPEDSWVDAVANRPTGLVALALAAAVVALGVRAARRALPPPLWPATFDADRQGALMGWRVPRRRVRPQAYFGWMFVEKVVLVGLVAAIFARILPGADARLAQTLLVTAYLIAINTLLSQWLARRGTTWRNTIVEFAAMGAANLGVLVVTAAVLGRRADSTPLGTTLFLVALLTLIVVLYDRAFGIYRDRQRAGLTAVPAPRPAIAT